MKVVVFLLLVLPFTADAQIKAILNEDVQYKFSTEPDTYAAGKYLKGDTVTVIGFDFLYAIIKHSNTQKTYIPERVLISSTELTDYKNALYAVQKKTVEVRDAKRFELYKKQWGSSIAYAVLNGNISLGMNDMMVKESIGKPNSINQTITEYSHSEQWVYNDRYLYFENHKLTAIQNIDKLKE